MAKNDYSGGFYCWNCGAKSESRARICPVCSARYSGEERYGGAPVPSAGGVGWSEKAGDPFFGSYAVKYTKLSVIWMLALSILIPSILLLTKQVRPEGEGLLVLFAVPAVIWLVGAIFLIRKFGGTDKTWDGAVEDKTEENKVRREKESNQNIRVVRYIEYTVVIRRNDGRIKRLIDRDSASHYLYFNIGDRVRVHDTKYLKYIEKYDKSRDDRLFCAACGSFNDVRDNFCERCGAPMLKRYKSLPHGGAASAAASVHTKASVYCEICGTRLSGGTFCEGCGARVKQP